MSKKIGIGIIGVTPGRSWAAIAHIPALRALSDRFEIVALSTTRQATADAAAKQFGVPTAYDNHMALVSDPRVDLVVVTVKVSAHFELVSAAITAGKHVYCEWPLGNGLPEAEKLLALAKLRGVRTAVGLQARAAPSFNYLRRLIEDGYVGEVLSTTLVASGMVLGAVIDQANAYSADKRNGANMLTIPFGHTIDAVTYVLGDFRELSAITANRRTQFTIRETGESRPMSSEDQVSVTGVLKSGAVIAAHYRGGMTRGATNMLWEINGVDGDLQMSGIGGLAQMFELSVQGARGAQQQLEPLAIPTEFQSIPTEAGQFAVNVGQMYERFANDLRDGTHTCPDFEQGVLTHRLLDNVEVSAKTGLRVMV